MPAVPAEVKRGAAARARGRERSYATPLVAHAMPPKNAYDPAALEPRWQQHWEEEGLFRAKNPGEPGFDPRQPKFYVLDMFPYPSGAGLHVGHPIGYIGSDIVARRKRMEGCNVL